MIVKMTILRILDSSDDKEKRSKARRAAPTALRSVAPEEPTHEAPVHPMVVGRTDAMEFWCRRESKPSQLIGTNAPMPLF